MNIYDISKKAGVSIATVSRVINQNPNVSEKTKEKVLAIIKECGYTPNAFARGLGLGSMNTIGILCADSSDPYFATAIYYLEQELRQNGYDSILCCTGYDVETKENYLKLLLSKRIDALILVGSNFVESDDSKNEYIREASKSVPIMLINGSLTGNQIYSILCDDYHAIYDGCIELLKSGCKNILYLYNTFSYSSNKKVAGYRAALEANQIKVNEDYIQYFNGTIVETRDFLTTLRNKGILFDGILTSDDSLAIGAIKYAKINNISIPEELSIIGYNNSYIATCCEPELTSIDNKLSTVCHHCVKILMDVFSGNEVPLRLLFPADITKRGTTRF